MGCLFLWLEFLQVFSRVPPAFSPCRQVITQDGSVRCVQHLCLGFRVFIVAEVVLHVLIAEQHGYEHDESRKGNGLG